MPLIPTPRARPALALLAALAIAGCARDPGPRQAAGGALPPPPEAQELNLDRALSLSDAAVAGGDLGSAVRILEAAAAERPDDADVRAGLADAYFRIGAYPEAGEAWRRLATIDPGSPAAEIGLGRLALATGDAAAAIARFETALAASPDSTAAANGRAVALDLQGRHAQAQAVYDDILRREPANRAVMTNRALSVALSGDTVGAIAALDALSRGPVRAPQATHNLALAYALGGQVEAAGAVLAEALPAAEAAENLAFYRTLAP